MKASEYNKDDDTLHISEPDNKIMSQSYCSRTKPELSNLYKRKTNLCRQLSKSNSDNSCTSGGTNNARNLTSYAFDSTKRLCAKPPSGQEKKSRTSVKKCYLETECKDEEIQQTPLQVVEVSNSNSCYKSNHISSKSFNCKPHVTVSNKSGSRNLTPESHETFDQENKVSNATL